MKQKVIGVDFDDVLMDFNGALCAWHNTHYGNTYTRADVQSYLLKDIWGCTYEESVKRIDAFFDSPAHMSALPVPGAIEAMRRLYKSYEVVVITGRPECTRDITTVWIEKYLPGLSHDIYFTSHFHDSPGGKVSKVTLCKKFGVSVFVEDMLIHARSLSYAEIPVFLYDVPWNQGDLPWNIRRMFGWDKILENILLEKY